MDNGLKAFLNLKISLKQLKKEIGNDLYNIEVERPQKVCAVDVIWAIREYMSGNITLQTLLDWVNVIWFTDLYEYNENEEESIASVVSLLETMDEVGVDFSKDDLLKMINSLEKNNVCNI